MHYPRKVAILETQEQRPPTPIIRPSNRRLEMKPRNGEIAFHVTRSSDRGMRFRNSDGICYFVCDGSAAQGHLSSAAKFAGSSVECKECAEQTQLAMQVAKLPRYEQASGECCPDPFAITPHEHTRKSENSLQLHFGPGPAARLVECCDRSLRPTVAFGQKRQFKEQSRRRGGQSRADFVVTAIAETPFERSSYVTQMLHQVRPGVRHDRSRVRLGTLKQTEIVTRVTTRRLQCIALRVGLLPKISPGCIE